MTAQDEFWSGEFGDAYHERNPGNASLDRAFFSLALRSVGLEIGSVLEAGAGIGNNLLALSKLLPGDSMLDGIEINEAAFKKLEMVASNAWNISVLDLDTLSPSWELVLTHGLLIHIAPDNLATAYRHLYDAALRYILLCEYFNPTPVEVYYRGNKNMMWKRDFAGDMLDLFPTLSVKDYGFQWSRDPRCPRGDITWWLMEKKP